MVLYSVQDTMVLYSVQDTMVLYSVQDTNVQIPAKIGIMSVAFIVQGPAVVRIR
jgi:hypothetical protein